MKINQDQAYLSLRRKLAFDLKRGSGHLGSYLANRFRWHYYPRLHRVGSFPDHLDIEISSACNMACPMCYTITPEFRRRVTREFMELPLFRKLVDQCAEHKAYSIRISLRGEPFIHDDAIEMIRYAKQKGIKEVSSLTNMLALTPAKFEQVLAAGLDWLTISFDGLGAVYEQIRRPARFDEAYARIQVYRQIKQRLGSRKPVIKVQTVWPAIKEDAAAYFAAFEPHVDSIAVNPLVDYLHKDEEIAYVPRFDCPVLYQRLVIGSDGIALLCSNDEFCLHPVGDANHEALADIWRGERMSEARKAHRQGRGVKLLEPCRRCYLPRQTETASESVGSRKLHIEKLANRPDEVGK